MDRRKGLWVLGVLALVIGVVLTSIDGRMWDEGGPGIIGFELAGSEERAQDILTEWGEDGRDAARLSLWLDFAYLAAYGAFLVLATSATRDLASRRGWRRLTRLGPAAVGLAVAAPVLDAVEDVFLLVVLAGSGGAAAPALAAAFATGKFLALAGSIGYVLAGLLARAPRRRVVAGAAMLGVAVVAFLAVNAWVVQRDTEPARAEGGRIVALPGGDIHVREDGPRGAPPLVLIHGFASSVGWWDGVVDALAERHRVIRVDLLGHGASEKPREGYSMESQADLVDGVMDRLGVEQAAVVGHSMGGLVATALVERHRARVARLMTIGTPNDNEGHNPGLSRRLAIAPVIGPAVKTLAPRRMVRAELERAFEPAVDVPPELVDDLEGMTFSAFRGSGVESADYRDERSVAERLAKGGTPLTVVFGSRDSVVDPDTAGEFRGRPRTRIVILPGLGHTPQIEAPVRTARLILGFAG